MTIIFTPASILELLNSIDELQDYPISITETLDDKLQIRVGDSIYEIEVDGAEEISVEEDVIEQIDEVNEDAYVDLIETGGFEDEDILEDVEAGLIKDAIKSMLLGGAIKLIKKLA